MIWSIQPPGFNLFHRLKHVTFQGRLFKYVIPIFTYWLFPTEPSIPDIQAEEEGEGEGGEGEAAEDPSAPTPATEPAATPAPDGAEGDDAKAKKGEGIYREKI